MTPREMQIEFERSLITINPEFIAKEKLTTDDIFAALNKAQRRYVELNYLGADSMEDGKRSQKRNVSALRTLIVNARLSSVAFPSQTNELYKNDTSYYDAYAYDSQTQTLTFSADRLLTFEKSPVNGSYKFKLPSDFFLYINSASLTLTSYSNTVASVTDVKLSDQPLVILKKLIMYPVLNQVIKEDTVPEVMTTAYNSPIIRKPCVLYNKTSLEVIADKFTQIGAVDIKYYRTPSQIGIDPEAACELPQDVHKDIVDLAVELFLTEGKYRLNMKPQNNQNQPKQEAQ